MKTKAQLDLLLEPRGRGGARPGAGRKPKPGRRSVPHRAREPFNHRYPIHVTMRMEQHVWNLRTRRCFRVIHRAFTFACDSLGCRIIDYSAQRNHIHLIVEAKDHCWLSRGMQGFCVRVARGLNKVMGESGRVFADRYHVRVLRTPREVRSARAYVLQNARRHAAQAGIAYVPGWVDPFSSAKFFDGWKRRVDCEDGIDLVATGPPVVAPKTWLLTTGWRRWGLVDPSEVPGAWKVAR
jgi:REP element-mobilizing transposase RayT